VVVVWCVAIVLLLTISIGWWVSLPVCYAISSAIEDSLTASGLSALRIVEYVALLWGPLWDIFIVFWAMMESHRVDITSTTYGG
jgi:hypothetical protein